VTCSAEYKNDGTVVPKELGKGVSAVTDQQVASRRSDGIQPWSCVSDFNIEVIQRYQNKLLKCIVNATRYVRNSDLHRDLGIESITDIIPKFANSQEKKLQDHINIEASRHVNVNNITRRLKRKKPFEVVRR
jgi:uncharacterized protein YeeX (DUF496 family)